MERPSLFVRTPRARLFFVAFDTMTKRALESSPELVTGEAEVVPKRARSRSTEEGVEKDARRRRWQSIGNASRPSSHLREPLSEAAAAAGPTRRLSRPSKVCRHLHPTLINVCPCLVRVGFAVILTGKSFRQASHSKQTLSSILSTSFLMNLTLP